MADKIVQLINKDGDNIYPVASVPNSASITMTNVDPGEGSALAADNYIGVYGDDPIILDYSTTEVSTGAKWIDGSTIYKKTINFGALPNNTTKSVPHEISSLSTFIKVEGMASSGTAAMVLPFVGGAQNFMVAMVVNTSNIEITTYRDVSGYDAYVTLYYTKSS